MYAAITLMTKNILDMYISSKTDNVFNLALNHYCVHGVCHVCHKTLCSSNISNIRKTRWNLFTYENRLVSFLCTKQITRTTTARRTAQHNTKKAMAKGLLVPSVEYNIKYNIIKNNIIFVISRERFFVNICLSCNLVC